MRLSFSNRGGTLTAAAEQFVGLLTAARPAGAARTTSNRRHPRLGAAAGRTVEVLESRVHLHAGHDHTADELLVS